MVFSLKSPTSNATALNRGFGAAEPIPLHGARLADTRTADKSSVISPVVVRGLVRLTDFLLVTALGLFIAHMYINETGVLGNSRYITAAILTGAAAVATLELLGLYTLRVLSSFVEKMPAIVLGWTIAFAGLVATIFFLKIGADVSRFWLGAWYLAGAVALVAGRIFVAWTMRGWAKSGRLYQRAVIYGAGSVTEDLIGQLEADTDSIVRIAGIFDDRDDDRAPRQVSGYPRLGGLDDLIAMSRATRLDLVIVALPLAAEDRLASVVRQISVLPADIKMPARATSLRFSPRTYSHVGTVAMIDLYDKPIADWGTISKWLFDKFVGAAALVFLAPVMALVALAVKLDSKGPVLFRQKRYGFNNEMIEVFKFRSMYTDRCDAAATQLVTKGDPRVTRVGRFIRKSSLDELPQLFNVLLGDLSLVGPRPHAVQAKAGTQLYDEVVDGYFARHKVKPGITGWAQINGWRGETDTEEKILKRVEHDLYYIENWSVFFDIYILLKTPVSLLKSENAY
ncbi:MAG: undecaprenyl-phosphate glucose phosphotransferase [Hyphomicrobium sp.]|nr:undecaprenyl-phosphate glucose phosphotransferase [Hyphomicrobium sp.]